MRAIIGPGKSNLPGPMIDSFPFEPHHEIPIRLEARGTNPGDRTEREILIGLSIVVTTLLLAATNAVAKLSKGQSISPDFIHIIEVLPLRNRE